MAKSPRSPEGRAAALEKNTAKARKRYKVTTTKKRKFEFEGEEELVKNMIVVLKLANYTNSQIAMIVGVSRGQVKVFLQDGNVQKQYLALKERLPQAALELGRAYLIEAVQAVAHVMRTSTDETVILKAASEMFDRFGIPKSSRVETTPTPDADGDDNPISDRTIMDKVRKASPEVQVAIGELQESFMSGVEALLERETSQ